MSGNGSEIVVQDSEDESSGKEWMGSAIGLISSGEDYITMIWKLFTGGTGTLSLLGMLHISARRGPRWGPQIYYLVKNSSYNVLDGFFNSSKLYWVIYFALVALLCFGSSL